WWPGLSNGRRSTGRRSGKGHVVRISDGRGGVAGGAHAGERAEIVDEVGLVVVAAVEGDRGPFDGAAGGGSLDGALEAADAAEQFGRKAGLFAEELDESAGAEADARGDGGDGARVRVGLEFREGKADGGMEGWSEGQAGEERLFEDAEAVGGGGGFEQ